MKPALVIVGLGNPGDQYKGTRHNVGFLAVETLAQDYATDPWQHRQKLRGEVCEGRIVTIPVLLIKPDTYMNDSGTTVRKVIDFYKLDPSNQILVVCDDIDQPVGECRLNSQGSPGTHNGLRSIAAQCGEHFSRLRIGIRGPRAPQGSFQKAGEDLSAYVLSHPSREEHSAIHNAIQSTPALVKNFMGI